MLVMLALVAGWPLARTIWFSFTDANLNNLSDYDFIGFENYLANYDGEWLGLLTDPEWWRAVWNTVWFALGCLERSKRRPSSMAQRRGSP